MTKDHQDDDPIWLLIRNRLDSSDDWSDLLVGEQIGAIRRALAVRLVDVEGQLSNSKARREEFHQQCYAAGPQGKIDWFASIETHEKWRAAALHYKKLVQNRLMRARIAQREYEEAKSRTPVDLRAIIRRLAIAIADHQLATSSTQEASGDDMRLWSLLDEIRLPNGVLDASLSDLLDTIWYDSEDL